MKNSRSCEGPDQAGIAFRSRPGFSSQILALGALLLLFGCGRQREKPFDAASALPAVGVHAQTVETKKLPELEEVVGTVRPKLHATIEAKTSGRITEMPLGLGQKLKQGELLVRLDAPEVKARLEQAEANLQQAEREWKRASSLFNQQAASRADFETADSRYQIAKGALAEARAMMGYVELVAPFDGVVTRKWADVGDLAAPGKPLVDIEDPSRLQLEADVPEAIAASIQPQGRIMVRVNPGTGDLAGTVVEIAPIADSVSRTFRVKLDLPNSPGLMSGQFARLMLPVGETASMRIPLAAIVQRGQMEIVFAVENQRAQLHLVKTGRRVNDDIEILSGLDIGDSVVVDNASQLMDGQRLQLK